MHSDAFDVIPFDDIKGNWKKLGAGSFGNVYKGVYLGIDVAIKEVLPSKEYDVAKYFEREWRLMKECRHPNICLFIGLSHAPPPDGRIFIVSEFIDNGNVRLFIHNKTQAFPWRLRLSFATDVARALAYLHARKCIHRDLKGENLLLTSNGRLKITDFGFARIAARSAEESKRLTFCGTDSYMSPEILLGDPFDLPTDIFSLGIIFAEIAARQLADDSHFKRHPPTFGVDEDELRRLASPDCPKDFLTLCIQCLNTDPSKRPTTRVILDRLRAIEAPLQGELDAHVGSIKFLTGGKRPTPAPRIPSFGMGVGKDIRHSGSSSSSSSSDDDEELMEAIERLSEVTSSDQPLLSHTSSSYSTTVVRSYPRPPASTTPVPSLSSILTIRPSPDPNDVPLPLPTDPIPTTPPSRSPPPTRPLPSSPSSSHSPADVEDPLGTSSLLSIASLDSYLTASPSPSYSSLLPSLSSSIQATLGSSLNGNYVAPLVHRFTLHKPGKRPNNNTGSVSPPDLPTSTPGAGVGVGAWNPLLLFSTSLLVSKCDVCAKRLGWKPSLECDDCSLRCNVLSSSSLLPHFPSSCAPNTPTNAPAGATSNAAKAHP
ncbi:hypothetical protein C0991_006452 [Blastosporella zonata]|nr:hypothetical protein C0991_006452 [Blastosporella zonata]